MMSRVFINHGTGQLTGGDAEISACPEVTAPVTFSHMRKLLKYFTGSSPLHLPHNFRGRYIRRRRNQNMYMVFTDCTTQDLNLEVLAGLAYKIPCPFSKITPKDMITVFRNPDEMIFNSILGMTSASVFHTRQYKQTASLKLPA